MRFETKREREQRRKDRNAQQFWVWYLLCLLLWVLACFYGMARRILKPKCRVRKQIKELQEQVDEEKQRTEELNEYKKYVQTKKFAEEIAKDKFGLIYPDEIIFKGKK